MATRSTLVSGDSARKLTRMGANRFARTLGTAPKRTFRVAVPACSRAKLMTRSVPVTTSATRGSRSCPAGVQSTCRPYRSKSCTPSSFSNLAI